MAYQTVRQNQEVNAVDIPTLAGMSVAEYEEYLEGGLFYVDGHDILRSGPAEYPIAATKDQLRSLIKYLERLKSRVGEH